MVLIPALEKPKQEDFKFVADEGYTVRLSLPPLIPLPATGTYLGL